MRALPVVALALAAISLACSPETTAPERDFDTMWAGTVVAPGGLLTLEHRNISHVTFGVSECGREVEALRGGAWELLAEELRVCPSALRTIHHYELVRFQLDVPSEIPDGMYRFRLRADAVSAAIDPRVLDIVSAPFLVKR